MKLKGKVGIVLTVLTGVGMIVTIVLAAKKAPEAQKMKEASLEQKRQTTGDENAQLTKFESFKAQFPCYSPVIFTAIMTVGSLIGSQILPQDAINDIQKFHQTYKEMNTRLNGVEAEKITENMSTIKLSQGTDGFKKETFVLKFDGRYIPFESTLLDVMEAEYDMNRKFRIGKGEVTFNEMLDLFHLEDKHVKGGDDVGWQQYIGYEFYGYSWIDFVHRRGMLDGQPVVFIDMPFPCHAFSEDECTEQEFQSELTNHGIETMW